MIRCEDFDGYGLYVLENGPLRLAVTELGAAITSLRFQGRELALGYARAADYLAGRDYLGAVVGRFANRIGGGGFWLNGRRCSLSRNEGGNTLHGGENAFDRRRWQASTEGESLCLSLYSPDGDNGFPGGLRARVRYSLEGPALRLDFEGEAEDDTVFAPTTHLYLNLDPPSDVRRHRLAINASAWLETDGALIPTGRLCPPEGEMDFSRPRPIGRALDHCFLLRGREACRLSAGGLCLSLETDFPALQVYTGEFLGAPFSPFAGLALEPEFCPDSPNRPEFASPLLRRGEPFRKYAIFRFAAEEEERRACT